MRICPAGCRCSTLALCRPTSSGEYFYIHETKDMPLEKIEKQWQKGVSPRKLRDAK
jgi:hypothetical protein